MQISNILSQVDLGAMALPEFQRGYVWNRDQVRELITSLYHRYPVGSLLVWSTRTDQANARGDASLQPGYVDLILDGQQRIASPKPLAASRSPARKRNDPDPDYRHRRRTAGDGTEVKDLVEPEAVRPGVGTAEDV